MLLLLKHQHGRTLASLKPRALYVAVLPPFHQTVCFLVLSLTMYNGEGGGGWVSGHLGSVANWHAICVRAYTAPQHLVCRAVQSLHTNHMQMSIIEVFICRRLHMNTSMILICIWLVCRLCTTLHTKCCGAVLVELSPN